MGSPGWATVNERPARLVLPLVLILSGVVFLLNNLGILPWSIWLTLAQLWPVILILLGVDLLLGRRHGTLGLALTLVVLVAIVTGAVVTARRGPGADAGLSEGLAGRASEQNVTVPLDGATGGDVTLHIPFGDLKIGALPPGSGNLLAANAALPPGMVLRQSSWSRAGVDQVDLNAVGHATLGWLLPWDRPFGSQRHDGMTWSVRLVAGKPLALRVDVGAGQSDLDLRDLMVQQLTLNSGAGQTIIRFPTNAGQTIADVQEGVGQIVFEIPPGVGAYLHVPRGGIVDLHVPADRFEQVNGGYETADYSTARNRVAVTLHLGAGSVDVR